MSNADATKIARLNDHVRSTFQGGTICMTAGINALAQMTRLRVFEAVRTFDCFTPDNDPYGEHDCGVVEVEGLKVIWKFDYYDPTFSVHSTDPADSSVTGRVLTIMLADEY